ncbi:tRNA (adenosine(37)-N6)-threonylcarbamoyltransferase complex dimerization subunit type 1 TsaB [Sagittula sp. S175]|uniref:tRNA (adenosine(37)-N6)-threonylcarbamoyltransferase complex dimerization subunit type 1 TsaB n=1 Tax=Sagittula sp. S175 TaxID=3415129 RepID=UPI003C7BD623
MILAFDTSAAHVSAALLDGARLLTRHEEMGRGQAERLMPLLEELLAEADATWHDLTAIAVGVGPGNFTGIRISVAAARGLALGLGIPAIGINGFDAILATASKPGVPCIPAPRGQAYLRRTGAEPVLVSAEELDVTSRETDLLTPDYSTLAEGIARAAANNPDTTTRPAPLYIKPADAAPSSEVPPVILDGA